MSAGLIGSPADSASRQLVAFLGVVSRFDSEQGALNVAAEQVALAIDADAVAITGSQVARATFGMAPRSRTR